MWPICIAPWLTLKIEPLFSPESQFWKLPYESWKMFFVEGNRFSMFSLFVFIRFQLFYAILDAEVLQIGKVRYSDFKPCTEHTELLAPWRPGYATEAPNVETAFVRDPRDPRMWRNVTTSTSHISPHSSNISKMFSKVFPISNDWIDWSSVSHIWILNDLNVQFNMFPSCTQQTCQT